jgi:prolyl oligopeptidase
LFDLLRYHRFESARAWKDEFGTAEDASDFVALASYSPYENIREGTPYPATMIVSGDLDQSCNPMHARKMVARLQGANNSTNPVILDYQPWRGHVPVLPLRERIESLTDRLAFICHQLALCD